VLQIDDREVKRTALEMIESIQSIIKKAWGASDEKKTLFDNFCSLSILQSVNYILPLITLPYLVRVLGAEKFGLVAFAQAFIQYFVILTDYGFDLSATREISIHREDKQKVSEIFISVLIIKFAFMVLSLILLCIVVFSCSKFKSDWQLYFLTFGIVFGQALFPVWLFQGMERMKYMVFLNLASKLFFTVLIFIVVKKTTDYIYVPLITSCGFILAGILGQWLAFRDFHIRPHWPAIGCLWSRLKDSTQFFLSRASVSIYTSSNVFFLGLFANNAVVGYYSAAEKIYLAFQCIYQPLTNAVYPYMAKYRNISIYKKIFKFSLILNSISCVLLFIFSRPLIAFVFGGNFHESVTILRIFSIALLFLIPVVLLGYPFLVALGFARYANGSVIAASLFHIAVLTAASAYYISGPMVAVLVVITTLMILVLRIYGVKKHKLWTNVAQRDI
jgi:PST family polysaccharide transporter